MPKEYPAEFKRDVVSVARQGERSKVQVAKDFGVSEACLYRWLKEDAVESGTAAGMTKEDSVQVLALRKRNKQLEQENEILRRAAAYFARDVLPK
jgi:transposase